MKSVLSSNLNRGINCQPLKGVNSPSFTGKSLACQPLRSQTSFGQSVNKNEKSNKPSFGNKFIKAVKSAIAEKNATPAQIADGVMHKINCDA